MGLFIRLSHRPLPNLITLKEKKMFQDFVLRIAAQIRADYNADLQPPATEKTLRTLSQKVEAEFFAQLPADYLEFLRLTDGLNWNGLFIYSCDKTPVVGEAGEFMHPFVETNLIWRDYAPHKDYLFYADSDISLYVYNLVKERYEILDRPSETLINTFGSFDELITEALKLSLHEDEDDDE
jgi:hypothetical protein